ncbi:Carbonic anhydrase/Acetyltransferase, isoleucine patch superfamily protein [Rickettsia akari str. Hartford]|uniref:Carbonic anhydrase/Acetyltransferase, isoleucine patch superfamily protein n=1 Tax=Rickettsia akari (strain Hartford) TaxID=293614 RepID=A8GNJ9_RICAH|nr:carbonic anhydrase [Rickettsia akari]ABV74974.1 Carbonic anhydrase/Acetyltransferase, isoleucine patch superfamily protein [Rickettsia akari str. Hartford]
MIIIHYKGVTPRIDKTAYIAEIRSLIGDVEIGSNSSIWFSTVLRDDVESTKI